MFRKERCLDKKGLEKNKGGVRGGGGSCDPQRNYVVIDYFSGWRKTTTMSMR